MKIYSYFQSYLFLKSSPLMKYLFTFGLFIFSLGNPLFSQENRIQFDNKAYVEGEFLVQLTDPGKMESILKNAPSEFNLAIANFVSPPMMIWLLSFDANAISASGLQNWLYSQKGVIVADYNYYVYERETMPNDPSVTQQWHHKNTGQTGGTVDADIDSDLAWDITTGGTTADGVDIVVCMVEGSGGNLNHQDLSPNRWVNTGEIPNNGIDDDNNGYIDDYGGWSTATNNDNTGTGGHGTSCLGMIGAKGDNGLNVVGANWDVKLMVVNMGGGLTQANVIAAYTYPYVMRKRWNQTNGAEGAFVVATSASWGIDAANPASYPLWCNFYDSLGHQGIINIGATTNSNLNVDTSGDMPTGCSSPYMVGVGRTDHNDNTAGGYGVQTIDFGAPGINVVTTNGTNGITTTTGTSFACPLTAGVVGLAYSIPCTSFMDIVRSNPKAGADFVLEALINGVDVKAQLSSKFNTGGRLNAKNTLDLLMNETCSSCYASDITVNVAVNEAMISFVASDEVALANLVYRKVGDANWTNVSAIDSPVALSNLEDCSTYEFYIQTECADETTNGSIVTFQTANCGNCVDLPYCASVGNTSTQERLAVLSPSTAVTTITNYVKTDNWGASLTTNYVAGSLVLMSGSGVSANEGCGTISNAAALNGNIAVALRGTCNFSEKALNAQNAGASALLIINNQATAPPALGSGAGAASVTIPVIMISQAQGNAILSALNNNEDVQVILGSQKQWVESFTFNGETITSGNNNGYKTVDIGTNFSLVAGQSYTFTVDLGFQSTAIPTYSRIWLDVNQNGLFDTDELMFDQGSNAVTDVNGMVTIPLNSLIGSTRMRVQAAYQGTGQQNLPGVCSNFSWGEVEDYCISIAENNVGISQAELTLVTVYPNPVKNWVNFEMVQVVSNGRIEIVDVVGKQIYSSALNQALHSVDVSQFNSGTYIYRIVGSAGDIIGTGKLVVEK